MSSVSADPVRLGSFVDDVASARTGAETEQTSLSTLSTTVAAGCPGRAVTVPALGALTTVLSNMAGNETFVATVRDALETADGADVGIVTVDVAVADAALAKAGLTAAPPLPADFVPATREVVAPTSGMVDDPINASNGNMIHREPDIEFPAIAAALNISRTWNSLLADRPGAFGDGWSSVLDVHLDIEPGRVIAALADGNVVAFVGWGDGWAAPGVPRLRLASHDDTWVVETDTVRRFLFDADGRLTGWHVGVARVSLDRDEYGRIVSLNEQATGRSLRILWTPGGLVDRLVSDDDRSVRYQRDAGGVLVGAVSDAGSVNYEWRGKLLESVVDADGVAAFVNIYDETGRVVTQTSPFGRVSTYDYDENGLTVFSDAAGVVQAMRHDRLGNLIAIIDVDGSAMRLAYNDARRVVQVVERDGATWRYRYDGDDLIERVDPDGLSQRWTWDDRHRLIEDCDRTGAVTHFEYGTDHLAPTRVVGPDGAVVAQTLDERGLPIVIVDADGVATRFRWDRDGQLAATIDALGSAIEFDYDRHGLLRRLTPPSGAATVLDVDDHGRVVRTERGDAVWEYRYTPAGRVCGGVEPGDVGWSATFGPHGAVETVTDAAGSTVAFGYDAIGNVTDVTAPDGKSYRHVFDEVGRLVAAVEPNGATTAKAYDRRGQLVELTDPRGNVWRRQLDALGRTVSSTTPDGAVTSWTYHANGQIESTTAPDGRVWRTEFDVVGRPVAMIDPACGRAAIEYTAGGRLRSRTSPAGRSEHFEYDVVGRLAAVVGIDGVRRELTRDASGSVTTVLELGETGDGRRVDYQWDDNCQLVGVSAAGSDGDRVSSIRRDAAGRVVETVDPTGASARFEWDRRGLLSSATDPAGLVTSYRYDSRGRLAGLENPGRRVTGISYGLDGHAAAITDPAGAVSRFERDPSGVVTGMRHTDGSGWNRRLDAAGREVERTGTDGAVAGRFDYDAAGRLATATAPDSGVTVEFLWDDNDRVEEVTGPDGTRRIERDADGWVIATVDPDGVRTEYERDARGRIIGAQHDPDGDHAAGFGGPPTGGEVRDRAGRLTIGLDGTVFRYDDAGRIAEIAPSGGAATSFTYSADGLIATERGPNGTRRFAYDDAGRVASVTTDGEGVTSISYDTNGRRVREDHSDETATVYRWDVFDRLEAIERHDAIGIVVGEITLSYDALGRAVVVDGAPVGYHPVTGLPDGDPWTPGNERPLGGVRAGNVWVLGARVLDPATHQFLSTDPLLPVPGSHGAASGYTYAWQDPVNWADPSGMRPLSVDEFNTVMSNAEQTTFGQAWDAIREDPWGTLAMVGVTSLGVGLCFVPGGQVVGAGILIGVGTSAGVGLATGTFSPSMVAVNGVVGGISAGVGGAVTTSSWQGAVALGMATGAGETVLGSALTGQGLPSATELLVGTGTGGLTSGGAHALNDLMPAGATSQLDHDMTPSQPPPRPLELTAGTDSNPWMPGAPIASMPAPAGTTINMAMAPGQIRPGGWGTFDDIPDVDFVRNNLAVTPEFKPEVGHVQTFEIPEGAQIQVGTVGPQTYESVTYDGGANQVHMLPGVDGVRPDLIPVGEPIPIS